MPRRAAKQCRVPMCGNLAQGGEYCDVHRRKRASGGKKRKKTAARGYGGRWRRLRKVVLAEEPLCRDPFGVHEGRPVPATDVDHIVPLARGGTNARSNLQGLCHSCHSKKTARETGFGRRGQTGDVMTKVWIVTGPPGAGKTTYVNERRLAGDLVVDVDALYTAVSGLDWYDKPLSLLPFVLAARDALIDRLCQPSEVQQAWVITSEADVGKLARMRERLKAELIVIETNPQECLRRIANDARRSDNWGAWEELIDKWWRTYEHSKIIEGGDSVVF